VDRRVEARADRGREGPRQGSFDRVTVLSARCVDPARVPQAGERR
jgi:hypothetical protein